LQRFYKEEDVLWSYQELIMVMLLRLGLEMEMEMGEPYGQQQQEPYGQQQQEPQEQEQEQQSQGQGQGQEGQEREEWVQRKVPCVVNIMPSIVIFTFFQNGDHKQGIVSPQQFFCKEKFVFS
jgi:hypothetical protein